MLDRQGSGITARVSGRCQEGSYERTKCGLQVPARKAQHLRGGNHVRRESSDAVQVSDALGLELSFVGRPVCGRSPFDCQAKRVQTQASFFRALPPPIPWCR